MSEKKKSGTAAARKKSNKLIYLLVSLGLIIVLVAFSLIPFGSQSVLARALDKMGMHRASMMTDMVAIGDYNSYVEEIAKIYSEDDPKGEDCESLWGVLKDDAEKIDAASMKEFVDVRLANSDYDDLFNMQYYVEGRAEFDDKEARAEIGFQLNSDVDQVEALLKEMGQVVPSTQLGKTSVGMEATVMTTVEKAYFNLNKIEVTTDNSDVKAGLKNWYEYDYNLEDQQKEGVGELVDLMQDLTETKMSDVFSDESGERMTQTFCKLVEGIDAEEVDDFKFGGSSGDKIRARRLAVKINPDYQKVLTEEMPELMEKMSSDETFKKFVEDKYSWLQDVNTALIKVDPSLDLNLPSKEEYMEQFNQNMEDFDKEKLEEKINSELEMTPEAASAEMAIDSMNVYINPRDGELVGYDMTMKMVYDEKYLNQLTGGSEEAREILEEGVVMRVEVYDLQYNENVTEVKEPEDYKKMDDFMVDAQNELVAVFEELQDEPFMSQLGGLFGGGQSTYNEPYYEEDYDSYDYEEGYGEEYDYKYDDSLE